mgnify:CR=1 FL=1
MKRVAVGFVACLLAVGFVMSTGCKSDTEAKCKTVIEKAFKVVPREMADKVKEKMAKQIEACKKLAPDEIDCFDKEFRKANKAKCDAAREKMKGAGGGE